MCSCVSTMSWPRRLLWAAFGLGWLSASIVGLVMLAGYSNSPGDASAGPRRWPTNSAIPISPERATLVMFVHPHCPCTRASLGELEKIVARCPKGATTWVVFFRPSATSDGWEETDLWRTADSIPGVHVVRDVDGQLAGRFHVHTSGETLLYDAAGDLLFSGGITLACGHSGDNAGASAVTSYLAGHSPGYCQTPVFGCPIVNLQEREQ